METHPLTRREEIDSKQATIAKILAEMGCEAAILFLPGNVAWFTGGFVPRGFFAESERPGIYTNGQQRWLISSNVDSQRVFEEELDDLGFQLKEWQWPSGRNAILPEMVGTKKVATDRPFPGMPMITETLRPHVASFAKAERHRLTEVGQNLSEVVGKLARDIRPGDTEREITGILASRLIQRGLEPYFIAITDGRELARHPRRGSTERAIADIVTIQVTVSRGGLYATLARTVSFGPVPEDFRKAFDAAYRANVVSRTFGIPGATLSQAIDAASRQLQGTPFEFDWRTLPPAYGTGWSPAEELRRFGADEPFRDYQPIVWQTAAGPARIIDTFLVTADGSRPLTYVEGWPFRRVQVNGQIFDVPEILVCER